MPGMGEDLIELVRRLEQLIRYGTIAELDLPLERCRVQSGSLLSTWVPWLTLRAGTTVTWSPPTVGEQCILFSPGGRPEGAFALLGLYSQAVPAPSHAANIHQVTWPDGTVVTYDHTAHALVATLAAGGHATLNADHVTVHCQTADVHAEQTLQLEVGDTLTVNAPQTSWTGHIALDGTLDGTQDVTASGISLTGHKHGGVTPGSGKTGSPE